MSQVAITALTLPFLGDTHYIARGLFTVSVALSILAIFFTCLQQRTLGFIQRPSELKAWLSNGILYKNASGKRVFQSSMVTHQLLQAPFEVLGIAITLFMVALGMYFGSAYTRNLALNSHGGEGAGVANRGVLGAFVAGTAFATLMFGQLLGGKDREMVKYAAAREEELKGSDENGLLEKGQSEKAKSVTSLTLEDGVPTTLC
jgi:hypothetical protein